MNLNQFRHGCAVTRENVQCHGTTRVKRTGVTSTQVQHKCKSLLKTGIIITVKIENHIFDFRG